MKKVVFVCLGNICRSPMAEFVMKSLTKDIHIESRATSSWEHGNPIHPGTQAILQEHAISYDTAKSSQQISLSDFHDFDLILAMDEQNVRDLQTMAPAGTAHKIHLFADTSVPDPYYTGNFDQTYQMVKKACHQWLQILSSLEK